VREHRHRKDQDANSRRDTRERSIFHHTTHNPIPPEFPGISLRRAKFTIANLLCQQYTTRHRVVIMINAAIVGLGWWGRTLVESAQGSDFIRFVAGATRTVSPEVRTFADTYKLRLAENFDALLKDSSLHAVVL